MSESCFTVLPSKTPDAIDLELALAGAVGSSKEDGMRLVMKDAEDELEAELAELLAIQREWLSIALPLDGSAHQALRLADTETSREASQQVEPAPSIQHESPESSRFAVGWFGAGLAAAAAVALAVSAWQPAAPEAVLDTSQTVSRGMGVALPVDHWVVRDGQTLHAVRAFQAGDRLSLRFTLPSDGFVAVLWVDGAGESQLLQRSPAGRALAAGTVFSLDGAVELDQTGGKEWVVVALTTDERDDATLLAGAHDLALARDVPMAARSRGWWATPVSRGR